MEGPQGPRKPLSGRRARSLDRSQDPRKDLELWNGQRLSLPTNPSQRTRPGRASDGSRRLKSPRTSETPGSTGAALSPEGVKELLPSEQRLPQDTKKDKAQSWAQQGLLKTVLNFFLKTGPEETREKASRRTKGKEGLAQPAETYESCREPGLRKKAHDKKANHKKHGHKKHVDEETKGAQEQNAEGQQAAVPRTAAAWRSEEADPSPGCRGEQTGREDSDLQQSLLPEGRDAGVSEPISQAEGHRQEEELKKHDPDTVIQRIVQLLREVGDRLGEEQPQVSQPEAAAHRRAPTSRKKSQEKKSHLKRTFSFKKHGSEEPKRTGAAQADSLESRPSKRMNFLHLCVGGRRLSIDSSLAVEEPKVQEALSTDCGGPSPLELSTPVGSQSPGEDVEPDRASESKEFIQKIVALLQDAEEQEGEEQLRVQEPEVTVENLAPSPRKKSQEKKSSFRKSLSPKKHGPKEPRKVGAAGAASLESRSPRRPSYLHLCVGGHRPSISSSVDLEGPEFQESSLSEGGQVRSSEAPSQARSHKPEGRLPLDGACDSKELIIQELVFLLQKVDGHLGRQIRRHPSFKRFFYQFPVSSLLKLAATLRRQGAGAPETNRNLTERPYRFGFGLADKYAGNNCRAILSTMGLCHPHFPYTEAQQDIPSPEMQGPD